MNWISVKDRLPELTVRLDYDLSDKKWLSKRVLVFIRYQCGMEIKIDRWTGFYGGRWEHFNPIVGDVTHWMPLPEPPKEDKE